MRVANWMAACLLGAVVASGAAQSGAPKDPYTAAETGKAVAPAKALDTMLSMLESQVMSAADAMPANKYSFAPTAATFAADSTAKFDTVRTFAQELTHLASANYFFYSSITASKPPAAASEADGLKTKEEIDNYALDTEQERCDSGVAVTGQFQYEIRAINCNSTVSQF